MAGGGQGLGLGLGQVEQLHLDRVDLAGQIGRVEAFDSGGHGRELLCIKDARCLQALPWGGRLVIDALAATVDGAGVADGLLVGVKKLHRSDTNGHSRLSSSSSSPVS